MKNIFFIKGHMVAITILQCLVVWSCIRSVTRLEESKKKFKDYLELL